MEWRLATMDGISPADPKGIFTEVYHTSRIISHEWSNCQAVKPVKRQTRGAYCHVYRVRFVKAFFCVTICGSHRAIVDYLNTGQTDRRTGHRRFALERNQDTAEAFVVIIYILGKRINYIQRETQIQYHRKVTYAGTLMRQKPNDRAKLSSFPRNE